MNPTASVSVDIADLASLWETITEDQSSNSYVALEER